MRRSVASQLIAQMHRLHRWTGTAMALLMVVWFVSGAFMTFALYPAYTDAERLSHSPPLTAAGAGLAPPLLLDWLRNGGLAAGGQARLSMLEGEPRWLLQTEERYQALRVEEGEVAPLDLERARAEAERTHGPCRGQASLVEAPDQWTVGRSHPGSYPLHRIVCDDASGLELYVSARSGEIIQQSTRAERALAWLGPIPHWIYLAVLRRQQVLWRDLVLWLSAFGCIVTVTGMLAGARLTLRARRQRVGPERQAYLRWHQRLGLGFGLFASTWLLSGALSLEPFHWASSDSDGMAAAAWSEVVLTRDLVPQLAAAISGCRAQLPELRELELMALGKLYAVCSDAAGQTRIVDLQDPALGPRRRISDGQLQQLAAALPSAAQLTLNEAADDFYYPTHRQPIARPYARFALRDAAETRLYVDPARAQIVLQGGAKKRLERWLYHGLHSWDFHALYQYRVLWRSVVISAMFIGASLATLGMLVFVRRQRRLRAHRQRSPLKAAGL